MSQLLNQLEELVNPLFDKSSVELVDITFTKGPTGWVLCFYLDKAEGITLDDCQQWSHKFDEVLDQTELIDHAYSLEVSSPGLNRPLKKLKDFEKYKGERVQIKLFAPIDGQKNFIGVLLGADKESIEIQREDKDESIRLPRSKVAKSTLDPKIEI